ncbi:MAG: pentapeptide repeat-containing protein, partial [Candidatus Thalassarchaeaceae archaeon]|nr:pentapeptide repeat-containing protein [Candidatus Thalassarchaeaceae archaeon]
QTLESDYQESLTELESSYLAAMEAAAIVNSQSLEEINATNAASINNLLTSLNTLQSNLQNSQDSINQISLIVEALDDENTSDGDFESQITALQQSLQNFQASLQSSIYDLENRINNTRAMNDFSYLDFQGAQLFNFNNGLGVQMDPPIFDFANLMNASLSYSNFSDASFVDANLPGADGIFSTFHRTDFSGASMYNGIWRQSDFSDALFVGSQLAYTEFRYSDLSSANLSGAVMYGGSDWLMVNLSGADLTNALMYDVDLRYADLTGADLTGARLAYLNPSYGPADITGVTWTNAICPDGTHASTVGNTCANNL